jgi:hypothetical protein
MVPNRLQNRLQIAPQTGCGQDVTGDAIVFSMGPRCTNERVWIIRGWAGGVFAYIQDIRVFSVAILLSSGANPPKID